MSWNWFFRVILPGAVIRFLYPMKIVGLKRVMLDQPAIFAIGPHTTEWESLIFASHVWRADARFFIKASYVDEAATSLGSRFVRWFMRRSGQIPIDRLDLRGMGIAIDKGADTLVDGKSILIYPEATRYYDGMLHPGGPLVARIAWRARRRLMKLGRPAAHVYPVGLQGFLRIQPQGRRIPVPFVRTTAVIGAPMSIEDYVPSNPLHLPMKDGVIEAKVAAAFNGPLMDAIAGYAKTTRSEYRAEITKS